MNLIHLDNVRGDHQREVMEQIQQDAVCPFCEEHLLKYHKKPILITGSYWHITENQWPYEGTKKHLLAISRRHVESFQDLLPEESAELFALFTQAAKEHGMQNSAIAMRTSGVDSALASTVTHLHAHLIQPDLEEADHAGVKFTISKPTQRTES